MFILVSRRRKFFQICCRVRACIYAIATGHTLPGLRISCFPISTQFLLYGFYRTGGMCDKREAEAGGNWFIKELPDMYNLLGMCCKCGSTLFYCGQNEVQIDYWTLAPPAMTLSAFRTWFAGPFSSGLFHIAARMEEALLINQTLHYDE